MIEDLLEKAYLAIISSERNYIKTGFPQLDFALKKYAEGSMFAFYGELSKYYLEDILIFLSQNGYKCSYLLNKYSHIDFIKKLLTYENSEADINELQAQKVIIAKWKLALVENSFKDFNDLKSELQKNISDFIFIENIKNIELKFLPISFVLEFMENFIHKKSTSSEQIKVIYSKIDEIKDLQQYSTETEISVDYISETFEEIKNMYENNIFTNNYNELTVQKLTTDFISTKLKLFAQKNNTVIFLIHPFQNDEEIFELPYGLKEDSDVIIKTQIDNIPNDDYIRLEVRILKNMKGMVGGFTDAKYDVLSQKFVYKGESLWKE